LGDDDELLLLVDLLGDEDELFLDDLREDEEELFLDDLREDEDELLDDFLVDLDDFFSSLRFFLSLIISDLGVVFCLSNPLALLIALLSDTILGDDFFSDIGLTILGDGFFSEIFLSTFGGVILPILGFSDSLEKSLK
jgi:hypothetical protein